MSDSNQLRLKKEIEDVVENAIEKKIFSGASISFSQKEGLYRKRKNYSFGYTTQSEQRIKVCKQTYFDLASLTKPLVTCLSIAVLVEKKMMHMDDNLANCCNWNIPNDKKTIKISHLLSHSSGLPAHKPYFQELAKIPEIQKKETLKDWILNEKMCFQPDTEDLYSDLGFILLGFLVEDIAGVSLDIFWRENVLVPLGLKEGLFFPKNKQIDPKKCAATKNYMKAGSLETGFVHDDNCRAMGGVGGHAGLFGTAFTVKLLCEHIIDNLKKESKHQLYSPTLLMKLLNKKNNSNWSYGFDTPTQGASSSGVYFSETSRGHLGFTGTSFWIDFEKDIVIVVLTNRVHMSDNLEGIRKFRPLIHDTIMQGIGSL